MTKSTSEAQQKEDITYLLLHLIKTDNESGKDEWIANAKKAAAVLYPNTKTEARDTLVEQCAAQLEASKHIFFIDAPANLPVFNESGRQMLKAGFKQYILRLNEISRTAPREAVEERGVSYLKERGFVGEDDYGHSRWKTRMISAGELIQGCNHALEILGQDPTSPVASTAEEKELIKKLKFLNFLEGEGADLNWRASATPHEIISGCEAVERMRQAVADVASAMADYENRRRGEGGTGRGYS